MRDRAVIWFPASLYDCCIEESERFYRLETGGALMGYWYDEDHAVVTASIGPGPNALHDRYWFEADHEWQLLEIAHHYQTSGRRETYLGDWHTHPDAKTGYPSGTDRAVLRRIIKTPSARADSPIMLIFYGGGGRDWERAVWFARLRPRPIIWPKLLLYDAELRLYQL